MLDFKRSRSKNDTPEKKFIYVKKIYRMHFSFISGFTRFKFLCQLFLHQVIDLLVSHRQISNLLRDNR